MAGGDTTYQSPVYEERNTGVPRVRSSGSGLFCERFVVTTAEVNAGKTLLAAIPGLKYRLHDAAMIAVGGAAATATSVDILGTQATSAVKLLDGRVAGLTENTLLRAGAATNGVILAAGASFAPNDVNTAITIGKTGSDLATATHIHVLLAYTLEV